MVGVNGLVPLDVLPDHKFRSSDPVGGVNEPVVTVAVVPFELVAAAGVDASIASGTTHSYLTAVIWNDKNCSMVDTFWLARKASS